MQWFLTLILSLGISTAASASGNHDHTETVCAENNTEICAHIGMHGAPQVNVPTNLMLHFMVDETVASKISDIEVVALLFQEEEVRFANVINWEQKDATHFKLSQVNFEAAGDWVIWVAFDFEGGESDLIAIPLRVAE